MNEKINSTEQARWFFIQLVLDEIREVQDFDEYYHNSFYVIAKLGLLLEAKEGKLFEGNEWSDQTYRKELMKRIETFLYRHIR